MEYHEATGAVADNRDALVSFMERYLESPLAVAGSDAYDAVTGESIGTEGAYGESYDDVIAGGAFWTLTDFHNLKEHGIIIDGRDAFERSLETMLRRIA